jgi:probable selenium-dependent hydroxylase accessory protein YqeC
MDQPIDLITAFALHERELVALVGAGGKSGLLFAFGRIMRQKQQRTILTTTTRLWAWQKNLAASVIDYPRNGAQLATTLDHFGVTLLVGATLDAKVTEIAPTICNRLFAEGQAQYLIVEADGARGLPIKVPAPHEPVIPEASTTVVVCMGIDALGGQIADVVFRPNLAADLLNCSMNDQLTVHHCGRLLTDSRGGFKGISAEMRVTIFINKIKTELELSQAHAIAQYALQNPRIASVIAANTRLPRPVLAVWKRDA